MQARARFFVFLSFCLFCLVKFVWQFLSLSLSLCPSLSLSLSIYLSLSITRTFVHPALLYSNIHDIML